MKIKLFAGLVGGFFLLAAPAWGEDQVLLEPVAYGVRYYQERDFDTIVISESALTKFETDPIVCPDDDEPGAAPQLGPEETRFWSAFFVACANLNKINIFTWLNTDQPDDLWLRLKVQNVKADGKGGTWRTVGNLTHDQPTAFQAFIVQPGGSLHIRFDYVQPSRGKTNIVTVSPTREEKTSK